MVAEGLEATDWKIPNIGINKRVLAINLNKIDCR